MSEAEKAFFDALNERAKHIPDYFSGIDDNQTGSFYINLDKYTARAPLTFRSDVENYITAEDVNRMILSNFAT